MAKSDLAYFAIPSLRGGQNDTDSPNAIADDECVLARNVEFFTSQLGERRLGCDEDSFSGGTIGSKTHVVFLAPYLPVLTEIVDSQLFAVGATPDVSTVVSYRTGAGWFDATSTDAILASTPDVFRIQATSIHGKLFVACRTAQDRMHIFDGANFRRAGIAPSAAAPTAADTAPAGTFDGDRIYRVRFILKSDSTILLRSEPSPELTYNPPGTKTGVVVTRPAAPGEGETDWELEASDGDGNFYRIATTVLATTTATDTTTLGTDYSDFPLSEDIGDYTVIESVKFVIADQDRLIFGGSWEDDSHGSRVSWTPTYAASGVGNDERIPLDTDNFVDLDWQDAGPLTGLSQPINGSFYAFKHSRIYKMQRTGDVSRAYESYLLTTTRGAIYGSIVNGIDEAGRPCIYFQDPAVGPCRISSYGMQFMGGIAGTWDTINTNALEVATHGIYYPDKSQVHWWVASEVANAPNLKIISQATEVQSELGETKRGWTTADGLISTAYCSCVLPEPAVDPQTGNISLTYRPYIGLANPAAVMRCDINDHDNGDEYQAVILTKAFMMAGILSKWGAMSASLLATPLEDEDMAMNVTFIRDFGKESRTIDTNFVPEGQETVVNKILDNLYMSDAYALQIQFSDPDPT